MHCESCGQDDPALDDGYTTCCNELPCYGDGDLDHLGTETGYDDLGGDRYGTETDFVRACCWAKAAEKFAATGRTVPAGSSRLFD